MAQADFTRISSNIAALNSLNSLRNINTRLGTSQLRLATGKRINQASDDPAGLTIALKMNARNQGMKVAMSNIGDAKNMLSVAESGLQQISDILTEMKSKATAAASDTLGTDERTSIQNQLKSLAKQINDIVSETQWNNSSLLDGTVNKSLQTGAGATDATAWLLSQDHDPVALAVASGVTTGASFIQTGAAGGAFDITSGGAGTTITAGLDGANAFGGLTELESGDYQFTVTGLSTAADTSKATELASSLSGTMDTFAGNANATVGYELASGVYTLTVDAAPGADIIDYTVTDSMGNIVATKDSLDTTADTELVDTNGNNLGITIQSSGLAANDTFTFEYIAAGEAKMELRKITDTSDPDNNYETQAVDANGSDDAGVDSRRSTFYVNVGAGAATYNTGLGFDIGVKAWANVTVGDALNFAYTAAGDFNVDVSNSSLASAYMTNVDNAIDVVSESLNSIGSLTARLDAKEQAIGVQQVNTEAAYNRIMNADMAYEQVEASKYMILQQTAVAMLAQANTAPQGILSLFR